MVITFGIVPVYICLAIDTWVIFQYSYSLTALVWLSIVPVIILAPIYGAIQNEGCYIMSILFGAFGICLIIYEVWIRYGPVQIAIPMATDAQNEEQDASKMEEVARY